MAQSFDFLTPDNPLLMTYAFYVSVLTLKILLMAPLTTYHRIQCESYISCEDLGLLRILAGKKAKVGTNEDIDRVRRAHLNDLENIPVFMVVSLLYVLSGPSVFLATMLFRIFTLARIAHSLVYGVGLGPHKARGMAWGTGFLITIFMSVSLIMNFL